MMFFKFVIFLLILVTIESTNDSNFIDSDEEFKKNVFPDNCANKALNSFLEFMTPEDYEEAKLSDIYKRVKHFNETLDKFERMETFQNNVTKKLEPTVKRLTARITEIMMEVAIQLPSECMTAMLKIGSGIQEKKTWAMKYTETFPVPNSGMEANNKPSMGYDECLEFQIPEHELNSDKKVFGQYCWLGIPDLIPEKFEDDPINDTVTDMINAYMQNSSSNLSKSRVQVALTKSVFLEVIAINNYRKTFATKVPFGLCLPNTCKAEDIEYALNKVLYPLTRLPLVINPDCDYADKPLSLNKYQWTAISVFVCLIILVSISTFYELFDMSFSDKFKTNSFVNRILQPFYGITNFKSIFGNDVPNNKFGLLDGIRTILSFWVLAVHEHILDGLPFGSKQSKYSVSTPLITSHKYMAHKNINIIDTFFFIGGMMTCYVMLAKLEKSKGRFNYIQYAVYRYLRVMPITIGAFLLVFLLPLFGSGPNWDMATSILYLPCRDNWLGSVLMTSNIDTVFPDKYICNTAGWYIPADYHCFLLAPIVFLVYYYYSSFAYIWTFILLLIGIFVALLPHIFFNIPHFFEKPNSDSIWSVGYSVSVYYWRTDAHLVSYMFGMFCGFLIRQKPKLYFGGRIGELFIWILSSALTLGSLYWTSTFFDYYRVLTKTEVRLYMAFSKLAYLSGWFWLCYACATGRGGFVNRFFSWSGFKSTSNLSFEVCIAVIFIYRLGVIRDPIVYSPYYCWTISCCDYVITYLFSIVFYLLVSAPFANIVNSFLQPTKKRPALKNTDNLISPIKIDAKID